MVLDLFICGVGGTSDKDTLGDTHIRQGSHILPRYMDSNREEKRK
jgi:hypothetical protein